MPSTRTILAVLCVASLLLGALAYAAALPAFAGKYTLGPATHIGSDVQITISLTLTNHTAADVTNATLALAEPARARISYGSLSGVSIPAGGTAQVSGTFIIPHALFQAWSKGASPAMSMSYDDANGKPVRAYVQF